MTRKRAAAAPASPSPRNAPAPASRLDAVDVLRGTAIVLMVAYHFCFDLNYFGAIRADFYEDPFWLTARTVIVSSFLLLVGVSLVLAAQAGDRGSYRRGFGALAACSALVSLATYLMFGPRWVFFGILHFILVARLAGPLFLRWHRLNLALGLALIAVGTWVKHPVFDQSGLQWIGLMTFKPPTEDYVPLLPWFGVVLLGIFVGQALTRTRPPWLLRRAHGFAARGLAWAGRHSLVLYMLHQPLLMGLLYAWFAAAR